MARELKIEAPELRLDPDGILEIVDWDAIFGSAGRVEVEIGIGKGRFLLTSAEARPEVQHLGVEWANQYLRIAEARALKRQLKNVRFARVDARELVRRIPSRSVAVYYVFYPDPWPKKRHQKRRFLQQESVDEVARSLVPAGMLHTATDHDDYWEAIQAVLDPHPAFTRLDAFGGDEFPMAVDAPLTNFEEKYATDGRKRHRASWQRVGGDWTEEIPGWL
jgi:tRNA (guanine-N7-)-methyltransferase